MPFEIPYGISCNASGNGKYTQQFGNDFWYMATVSGSTTGNPSWTLTRNGSFLRPGLGPAVLLSAGLCSLGTKLEITVANASPNAVVTGLIHGLKATHPQDLLAVGAMDTASTFTAQQANTPEILLATLDAPGGTQRSVVLKPPPSTTAIGWVEDQTAPGNPFSFVLIGNTTQITYFSQNSNDPGFSDAATSISPWVVEVPTSVEPDGFTFFLDATLSSACRVEIYAYTATAVVNIRQNGTDVFRTTSNGTNPATWQVPNNSILIGTGSIAAGGSLTLVNPPVSGFVRIFDLVVSINAAANNFIDLIETPGLTPLLRIDGSVTRNFAFPFRGMARQATEGIQLKNNSAAASAAINGMFTWHD